MLILMLMMRLMKMLTYDLFYDADDDDVKT